MAKKHKDESVDDNGYDDGETQSCSTLLVVIISLIVVAVFGGALVGGVMSGDASNGFFFTIIAASAIGVLCAIVSAIRYCCSQSKKNTEDFPAINKEKGDTFNSDEEEGEVVKQKQKLKLKQKSRKRTKGPQVSLIDPAAVGVSDVSVLSPNTYDVNDSESVMTDTDATGITSFAGRILLNKSRQRKPGFDFTSVVPGEQSRGRADPPEANVDPAIFAITKSRQMGPRDPSANRVTKKGAIQQIAKEPKDVRSGHIHTPSTQTQLKVIDVDEETTAESAKTPSSVASGIFRGFFANAKKLSASTPVARNFKPAPQGRPPMPDSNKPNNASTKKLQTINGGLKKEMLPTTPKSAVPSSPGKSSVFSIPPPRRVPSSPGAASEAAKSAFSEGYASSTFDPVAHARALAELRDDTAALGATGNDVPVYYDEEDDDGDEEDIYDVFAPPGPIGIVVDSTPKGCVVHSLRKTSSMQGLINPGDLIVALDDEDVTALDASELTKLMARKAQQTERKFTLIAA